eukprot:246190-Pyramimonas_sp.AAC.1
MLRCLNEANGNKRNLTRDNLWDASAQPSKPMPPLPMSHRLDVTVAREPPAITPTNVKKDGDKNKGKGKGKDMICRSFKETGKCSRGKECWFAQTTDGHP